MHLLAAQQGRIDDGSAAVDLGQTPGEIIVLSAADSEIACLSEAQRRLLEVAPGLPSLRLARLLALRHHYSVDLYVEQVISQARLVVVRLLGGESYWPYGVEQLLAVCTRRGIGLILMPGDDRDDPDLLARSTVEREEARRAWGYLVEGGSANAEGCRAAPASAVAARRSLLAWRGRGPLPVAASAVLAGRTSRSRARLLPRLGSGRKPGRRG